MPLPHPTILDQPQHLYWLVTDGRTDTQPQHMLRAINKKLSYRRLTALRATSVEIMSSAVRKITFEKACSK